MENIFLPDITLPLYKQYASLFEDFYKNYPTLEGPFLVSITERYISQKTRLLFIGQQTNSWERTLNIHTQQKFYEDFNFGEKYRSSPFWNVIRRTEEKLGVEPYASLWLNVNRYDENDGKYVSITEQELMAFDSLLISEIGILKPDIVIFFTGPKFDNRLCSIFNGLKINQLSNFSNLNFKKLNHAFLPERTLRSYHPKYLRMSKQEQDYYTAIQLLNHPNHNTPPTTIT